MNPLMFWSHLKVKDWALYQALAAALGLMGEEIGAEIQVEMKAIELPPFREIHSFVILVGMRESVERGEVLGRD